MGQKEKPGKDAAQDLLARGADPDCWGRKNAIGCFGSPDVWRGILLECRHRRELFWVPGKRNSKWKMIMSRYCSAPANSFAHRKETLILISIIDIFKLLQMHRSFISQGVSH